MDFQIKPTSWQADKADLSAIREQVFMREQKVSAADEWDDKDETATHFLVMDDNKKAVACARVLVEDGLLHIGRVAVLAEYRQQGIGHSLMQALLHWCAQQKPGAAIYLHAQTSRINFYTRLGFVTRGDIFIDAGIPHIAMWYQ